MIIAFIVSTVKTVVILFKREIESKKVRVEFSLEDIDMSDFQNGATYWQIKEYVKKQMGLSVLYELFLGSMLLNCNIVFSRYMPYL